MLDNPDGELFYGYVEYRHSGYGFNLKAGRQHIFEGVINDSIDGLGIKTNLTPSFDVALYGGVPVALSTADGRSGDAFWGGRIAEHAGGRHELGLSYKRENSNGEKDGELLGVDLSLTLPQGAYISGRSSYNLQTSGWGEHFIESGFDVATLHIRPAYER